MINDILSQLKYKYTHGTIVEKLIGINILLFVLTYFIGGIGSLFQYSNGIFYQLFALPANTSLFIAKPWTIITYGFIHSTFIHLLFNLITLYYIGNLFLDYFIPKKLLNFYLLGTLVGGILFILGYSYFPALKNTHSTLVGASAGIMAIVIGLATYIPNYEIKFRFIGYVKLKIIALIFIVWDLISLGTSNTGGHLAHLGGAAYGFFAIYYQQSFTTIFSSLFKQKTKLKTSYKSSSKKTTNTATSIDTQAKINRILDKISKSGYESLSKSEKEFLFQQGKK